MYFKSHLYSIRFIIGFVLKRKKIWKNKDLFLSLARRPMLLLPAHGLLFSSFPAWPACRPNRPSLPPLPISSCAPPSRLPRIGPLGGPLLAPILRFTSPAWPSSPTARIGLPTAPSPARAPFPLSLRRWPTHQPATSPSPSFLSSPLLSFFARRWRKPCTASRRSAVPTWKVPEITAPHSPSFYRSAYRLQSPDPSALPLPFPCPCSRSRHRRRQILRSRALTSRSTRP